MFLMLGAACQELSHKSYFTPKSEYIKKYCSPEDFFSSFIHSYVIHNMFMALFSMEHQKYILCLKGLILGVLDLWDVNLCLTFSLTSPIVLNSRRKSYEFGKTGYILF